MTASLWKRVPTLGAIYRSVDPIAQINSIANANAAAQHRSLKKKREDQVRRATAPEKLRKAAAVETIHSTGAIRDATRSG